MRGGWLAVALVGLLMLAIPVRIAQQDIPADWERLAYGETVAGEITDAAYEAPYVLQGRAGQVIVATMRSVDRSLTNPLLAPVLVLRDPDNAILADTTALYPIDDTTLVAEFPMDGDYLLLATREGGPLGTSYGRYTLTVARIPELVGEEAVSLEPGNGDGPHYLTARMQQPFTLVYEHQAGTYFPRVEVAHIDAPTGSLDVLAGVMGRLVDRVCLGTFPAGLTTIVRLSPDESAFSLEPATAEIRLRLSTTPCPTVD